MAPSSGSRAVQLTCRSTHRSSADLGIGRMFRYRPEIFGASFAIFLTISPLRFPRLYRAPQSILKKVAR